MPGPSVWLGLDEAELLVEIFAAKGGEQADERGGRTVGADVVHEPGGFSGQDNDLDAMSAGVMRWDRPGLLLLHLRLPRALGVRLTHDEQESRAAADWRSAIRCRRFPLRLAQLPLLPDDLRIRRSSRRPAGLGRRRRRRRMQDRNRTPSIACGRSGIAVGISGNTCHTSLRAAAGVGPYAPAVVCIVTGSVPCVIAMRPKKAHCPVADGGRKGEASPARPNRF